ncbi:MAG: hypothetical protein WB610_08935 [Rhodomicrobium sp.]
MSTLQRKSTRDRADAEARTQAGIDEDGRKRFRSDKEKALLYRCTRERREQITRLAEALSAGNTFGRKVSFTETMDMALDALEAKLKGGK